MRAGLKQDRCIVKPMPTHSPAKRTYNSSRRTLQAAQTRDEVVRAAIALFRDTGWAGTTLAAIAEPAGVSVETIYKALRLRRRRCCGRRWTSPSSATPSRSRSPSAPSSSPSARATLAERIARPSPSSPTSTSARPACGRPSSRRPRGDAEVDAWRLELEQRPPRRRATQPQRVFGRPARRRPRHDAVGPLQPRDLPQARRSTKDCPATTTKRSSSGSHNDSQNCADLVRGADPSRVMHKLPLRWCFEKGGVMATTGDTTTTAVGRRNCRLVSIPRLRCLPSARAPSS